VSCSSSEMLSMWTPVTVIHRASLVTPPTRQVHGLELLMGRVQADNGGPKAHSLQLLQSEWKRKPEQPLHSVLTQKHVTA
jgi:hypothetical protein